MSALARVDLGEIPYAEAMRCMRGWVEERRAGRAGDRLFLLSHPPVITYGPRTDPADLPADLGVPVQEIGRTLETMMGSRQVTTYVDNGEEYDVMLQAGRENRVDPSDLAQTYVRGGNGELVPLSNLVTLSELAEPGSLNRFNRLRAITISAGLSPGYSMGEALEWTRQVVSEELPDYAQIDWKGESREYQEAGGAILLTFTLALLIVRCWTTCKTASWVHWSVVGS